MPRLLFLTLLILSLNGHAQGQKFSGQVYILSEDFLEDRCEVLIESGECSTDLIFLNDKTFAMVNRCALTATYYGGNYVKKKDILHLAFKPVTVMETYDAASDRRKNEKKKGKISPVEFQVSVCDEGKVTFAHATIKDYRYGSRISGKIAREKIIKLKVSKCWKMISG